MGNQISPQGTLPASEPDQQLVVGHVPVGCRSAAKQPEGIYLSTDIFHILCGLKGNDWKRLRTVPTFVTACLDILGFPLGGA